LEFILGIDIAKATFQAALLCGDDKPQSKNFPNTIKGFAQLEAWLKNRKVVSVRACLEATNAYWEALAYYLNEHGHQVSVVNPSRPKAYGQSEMLRTKNDAVDAALIARFCRAQRPALWIPPEPEERELQGIVRRYASVIDMRQQERNREQVPGLPKSVKSGIRKHLAFLDRQTKEIERLIRHVLKQHPRLQLKRDLLTSIPGIGEITAARLLAEMPNMVQFKSAKEVAAFAGLSPQHFLSGTSVRGRPRLSKTGSSALRRQLFFPAVTAMHHNPRLQIFAARLIANGKPRMLVVGAVMRKLLVLAYGVLKSGMPFDLRYQSAPATS
jgi:transposase